MQTIVEEGTFASVKRREIKFETQMQTMESSLSQESAQTFSQGPVFVIL